LFDDSVDIGGGFDESGVIVGWLFDDSGAIGRLFNSDDFLGDWLLDIFDSLGGNWLLDVFDSLGSDWLLDVFDSLGFSFNIDNLFLDLDGSVLKSFDFILSVSDDGVEFGDSGVIAGGVEGTVSELFDFSFFFDDQFS